MIACDTDVVLDGKALGKPADEREAREYLDRMSGRAHEVLSGLVVLSDGEERIGLERTTVVFKELGEAEKERYVRSASGGGARAATRSRPSARRWSRGSREASPTSSVCRSGCSSSWRRSLFGAALTAGRVLAAFGMISRWSSSDSQHGRIQLPHRSRRP